MESLTKNQICELVERSSLNHVAFIMDGNGRWATARHLPREAGHKAGTEAFHKLITYCYEIGIKTITVYAFSTENWKRPATEVNALMLLLGSYIDKAVQELSKNKTRFIFLGDKSKLPALVRKKAVELEEISSGYERVLNIALNYGGRDEIVHAVNNLIKKGYKEVDEELLSSELYTSLSPDPDLIIRTASEYRLSNFLLWQAAYSEFWFTDVLWPDINEEVMNQAVVAFSKRKRKFGGLAGDVV